MTGGAIRSSALVWLIQQAAGSDAALFLEGDQGGAGLGTGHAVD